MAGKAIAISDAEFEQRVLKSDKPVMVDFWAPWCPPCRAIAPIVETLAGEYDGKVVIAKVNTDEDPRYMVQYGIQSIPTMLFFKNGEMVKRLQGAAPKRILKDAIDEALAS